MMALNRSLLAEKVRDTDTALTGATLCALLSALQPLEINTDVSARFWRSGCAELCKLRWQHGLLSSLVARFMTSRLPCLQPQEGSWCDEKATSCTPTRREQSKTLVYSVRSGEREIGNFRAGL